MSDRRELLNDPEEAIRVAMTGQQAGMWTCLPAIVVSVDLEKMTLTAQPTIKGVVFDENNTETFVNLPVLADVPICFPRAGGFIITFPIKADDEVLIVFASRCIDAWWQSGGIQKPMEMRMHDLSDGFAVLAPSSQPKVVENISSTAVQIRNDEGAAYVEIGADGKIKLKSTEVQVEGNLKVTGAIEATTTITANTATVPISVTLHTHTSAAPGSPTGPPLP